jgi:hypothetical protein
VPLPPIGWLLFGLIWLALGWRMATVPGSGWRGPREGTERLAQTPFGRFISVAVGVVAMLVGLVMTIGAVIALVH